MLKKIVAIFATGFLTILTYAQRDVSWGFNRVSYYDGIKKKTVIDSVTNGKLILDKSNKVIWVIEKTKPSFIPFNSCEAASKFDTENICRYILTNYSLTREKTTTYITYAKEPLYAGNSYGKLTLSIGNDSKTYFIFPDDSTIEAESFVTFVDTSLANLSFDWVKITEDNDGDVYFIQNKPIDNGKYSNVIKVWQNTYTRSVKYKNVTYKNVQRKSLVSFNCEDRQMQVENYYYYDSKGKFIGGEDLLYFEWKNIIPGTLGEALLDGVCNFFKNKK